MNRGTEQKIWINTTCPVSELLAQSDNDFFFASRMRHILTTLQYRVPQIGIVFPITVVVH